MTAVDQLVRNPGAWLAAGQETEVIISSRIRLARNIRGHRFPGWAKEEERLSLWRNLVPLIERSEALDSPLVLDMGAMSDVDRQVLCERHLISHEMMEKGQGSGLILKADETLSVMVNEEDHLRLQAMRPGLHLEELWKQIDALDTEIESGTEYAFSSRLGYLTACPTNVGTGIRASVMLHLPGLRFTDEIDPVVKGLGKVGLAVRGLMGEGTDAFGNMFQISNQTSLGESEDVIIQRLVQIVLEVVEHERHARARLVEQMGERVLDRVGRAYGILRHAHVLSSGEALDLLSALRFGVELGVVRGVDTACLNQLMILTQPGHLQKIHQRDLEAPERDQIRARVVRDRISAIRMSEHERRQ